MASPAPCDPRWALLLGNAESAAADLAAGAALYRGELQGQTDPRQRRLHEKAFQKFLQDGYASVEKALSRVLALFDEPQPHGGSWHSDLLRLATLTQLPAMEGPGPGRPPFAPELAADLRELMRFRHIAIHGYEDFDLVLASPAAAAAGRVAEALPGAVKAFGRAAGLLR